MKSAGEETESETAEDQDSPEEATKKPRGRPRKDGMEPGSVGPVYFPPIPRPSKPFYNNGAAARSGHKSPDFFKYWSELPEWAKRRILCYVYRQWPVLIQAEHGENYIDKVSGEKPIEDETEALRLWGCGDYRLQLVDADVDRASKKKGDDNSTLATCYLNNLGGHEVLRYPPMDKRVRDQKQLDINAPINKSYVDMLRTRGLLKEANQENEEEMAQADIITKMMDRQDKTMEQLIEAKTTAGQSLDENAASKALAIAGMGFNTALEIIGTAAKTSIIPAPTQQNPMEMASAIIQIAKALAPPTPAQDPAVTELLREVRELRQQQTAAQNRRPAEKNFEQLYDDYQRMSKVFGKEEKPGFEWGPLLAGLMPVASPLIGAITARIMTSINPPQPNAQAPAQVAAPVVDPVQEMLHKIADTMDQQLSQMTMDTASETGNPNAGTDFADWFIAGGNAPWHEQIKQIGARGFYEQVLLTSPHTSQIVRKYPPANVIAFLEQFVGYRPQMQSA